MSHNILLIGGHGKVSQILTPLLLARSWNVTSLIRSPDQTSTIEKLGEGQSGKLSVLVSSLEEIKSESDAKKILDQVQPDWVVWSAGELSCSLYIYTFSSFVRLCSSPLHNFEIECAGCSFKLESSRSSHVFLHSRHLSSHIGAVWSQRRKLLDSSINIDTRRWWSRWSIPHPRH